MLLQMMLYGLRGLLPVSISKDLLLFIGDLEGELSP